MSKIIDGWRHAAYVKNDQINYDVDTLTQQQLENYIIKETLKYSNCSKAVQRYYMMIEWVYNVVNLKWSGGNSASYFDGLGRRTRGQPPVDYDTGELYMNPNLNFTVWNFKNKRFDITPANTNPVSQVCFKTTLLQIECKLQLNPNTAYWEILVLNLTFYFPENKSPNKYSSYILDYGDIVNDGPGSG